MIISVSVGFIAGATFFAVVGTSTRPIEIVIGLSVLLMAGIQTWRMVRRHQPVLPTPAAAAVYGSLGGFTTFVANAAGPILNTHLVRLGLGRDEIIEEHRRGSISRSTSPRFPCTWRWVPGRAAGRSSQAPALAFDAVLIPALLVGVFSGRELLHKLPEKAFVIGVLVLSAVGAVELLLP